MDANHCAIGSPNNWTCYDDKKGNDGVYSLATAYSSNTCGSASPQTRNGTCARCEAGGNDRILTNTGCCDGNGKPTMDVYDTVGSTHATHAACTTMGLDRNSGYSRNAAWFDPRALSSSNQWEDWKTYDQNSLWSVNGACNLDPSANTEPQNLAKSTTAQPGYVRCIRANLTPKVDERDWYAFQIDDNPNSESVRPRMRIISHGPSGNGTQKSRLEACGYVDCIGKSEASVNIQEVRFRGTGRGKLYSTNSTTGAPFWMNLGDLITRQPGQTNTTNWGTGGGFARGDGANSGWLFDRGTAAKAWMHSNNRHTNQSVWYNSAPYRPDTNSPAYDARGGCFQTDDNGVLDLSFKQYDCDGSDEAAWIYVTVSLPPSIAEGRDPSADTLTCQDLKYTMYYGNDRSSSSSNSSVMLLPSGSWHYGCDDCCNETSW